MVGLAGLVSEAKTGRSLPRMVARLFSRPGIVVDGPFPSNSSAVRRRRVSEGRVGKGRGIESGGRARARPTAGELFGLEPGVGDGWIVSWDSAGTNDGPRRVLEC